MEPVARRLLSRVQLRGMKIRCWKERLLTCELLYRASSKSENGIRWLLTFSPKKKRREWEPIPANVETDIQWIVSKDQDSAAKDGRCACEECSKRQSESMADTMRERFVRLSRLQPSLSELVDSDVKARITLCMDLYTTAIASAQADLELGYAVGEAAEETVWKNVPDTSDGFASLLDTRDDIASLLESFIISSPRRVHPVSINKVDEDTCDEQRGFVDGHGRTSTPAAVVVDDDVDLSSAPPRPSLGSSRPDVDRVEVPLGHREWLSDDKIANLMHLLLHNQSSLPLQLRDLFQCMYPLHRSVTGGDATGTSSRSTADARQEWCRSDPRLYQPSPEPLAIDCVRWCAPPGGVIRPTGQAATAYCG